MTNRVDDPTPAHAQQERLRRRTQAERMAREMGLDPQKYMPLLDKVVTSGMYEDQRSRLKLALARAPPTSRSPEEWSWIQAHCSSARVKPPWRVRDRSMVARWKPRLPVPTVLL